MIVGTGVGSVLRWRGATGQTNLHEDVQVTAFRTARNLLATFAAYSAPMRNIRAISGVLAAFAFTVVGCTKEPAPPPAPSSAPVPATPPPAAAKPPLRIGYSDWPGWTAFEIGIQKGWFKYTRKRYGEGRRFFLMAPIHHHFEKKGWYESQVVTRFYILCVLFAVVALSTLKVR